MRLDSLYRPGEVPPGYPREFEREVRLAEGCTVAIRPGKPPVGPLAANVKRLPVVDDLGRLLGIVTRGDLLKVHLRGPGRACVSVGSLAGRPPVGWGRADGLRGG